MDRQTRVNMVDQIRDEYAARFQTSLRDWLRYHQDRIVFSECTYMGIHALKNPLDAWIYQELLYRVRPDVVVEIGAASGGSTLYLAHLLHLIGEGTVVSVDNHRTDYRAQYDNVVEITGDSSSPEIVEHVAGICQDRTCMVIHDADHSYRAVLRDLSLYAPLVSTGSYLVVEDGIVDLFVPAEMNFDGPGPLHAIVEFLDGNMDFEVDRHLERYLLTYNPYGFLRRVRSSQSQLSTGSDGPPFGSEQA